MTDDEINRAIAESLEPLDTLRHPRYYSSNWSPMGFWHSDVPHGNALEREWQPRNFLTDPAMRDLLQAKLLEEGWFIRLFNNRATNQLVTGTFTHPYDSDFELEDTRERIWPLAYLAAKGVRG
jgi:hypothetical protein